MIFPLGTEDPWTCPSALPTILPMRSTVYSFLLLGIVSCAAADSATASDVVDVLGRLTPFEQRVLHGMAPDPALDARLRSDLRAVISLKSDELEYEAAKLRFEEDWINRITDFSNKYRAGDAALLSAGQGFAKPTVAEVRAKLGWLSDIGNRDWGGRLIPTVLDRINPYEAGYTLAALRAFNQVQRQDVVDQLKSAKTWRLPLGAVANTMIDSMKQLFVADMGYVVDDSAARVLTARQSYAQLEAQLVARANIPDIPEDPTTAITSDVPDLARAPVTPPIEEEESRGDNASAGSNDALDQLERIESVVSAGKNEDVEGAKESGDVIDGKKESVTGVVVIVDGATTEIPAVGLEPSGDPEEAVEEEISFDDIPVPPPPEGAVGENSGSKLSLLMKSPVAGAGLGVIIGGLLGFLLGGPVGAAIGALAGGGVGYKVVAEIAE